MAQFLKLASALAPLFLVGALVGACGGSSAEGGGGNGNGGNGGSNNGGHLGQCPCPSGQFCFNGLCAIGCNSNGDCAADQYCDTSEFGDRLCHNKTVSTCPDSPCASNQVCSGGVCSTASTMTTSCTPSGTGNDGCDKYAVCFEEQEGVNKCHTFPACAENGSCPTGTHGAVCNEGYIPNKARFCMTGLCKDATNCPSNWKCVRGAQNDVLGFCSQGTFGEPCATTDDCTGGLACQPTAPGSIGFCTGGGGAGSSCMKPSDCQAGLTCQMAGAGLPGICSP